MTDITLSNLRKSYGTTDILHGLNLNIASGEFIVLLGPSGCGKSTLLRTIAGLESVSTGEISIGGKSVNQLEPRQRGCAMVFQNYALYPHMSVAQNIGYALKIAGISKSERSERIRKVAEPLGLLPLLDRKPSQLSGGQRQRVAMGRAMIREPKVFLYDEPLSNLDARLRVSMRVEIRKLHQRLGTTTLFVTHDQIEAMTLADRIVVMYQGVIEQVGTPSEIYDRPQSTFVAEFIGAPGMNLLQVTADPQRSILRFSDGQELNYDPEQWPEVPQGIVTLGYRAEAVQLTMKNTLGLSLRAQVEFSEELGAAKLVHTSVAGQPMIVHVAGSYRPQNGSQTELKFNREDIHLFNTDTGKRLPDIPRIIDQNAIATTAV